MIEMDEIDRDALLDMADARRKAYDAGNVAMGRYWEGRIDGHCLQCALDADDLAGIGITVEWMSPLLGEGAP